MTNRLRIGEMAALLGVTTKTVRHYHRIGLLAEPARTAGGYRLYGAAELMRLQRIRRLQALGLSLAQIKTMLGEADQERPLRQVLQSLLAACEEEIRALEARRQRFQELLARSPAGALDQPAETPDILRWARERLGEHLPEVSPAVWEQDTRLFGMLEDFNWPGDYQERMRAAVDRLAEHPEVYQLLARVGETLAALAALPEDATEIERLADEFIQSGLAALLQQASVPQAPPDPYGDIFGDVLLSALAPAQRRFFALLRQRMPEAFSPSAP